VSEASSATAQSQVSLQKRVEPIAFQRLRQVAPDDNGLILFTLSRVREYQFNCWHHGPMPSWSAFVITGCENEIHNVSCGGVHVVYTAVL
jgi:hypothetical protein